MAGKKLKCLDLFAGIGGIRIGFESAGFEAVYANDFDKGAAETYRLNFGEIDEDNLFDVIRKKKMEGIPKRSRTRRNLSLRLCNGGFTEFIIPCRRNICIGTAMSIRSVGSIGMSITATAR